MRFAYLLSAFALLATAPASHADTIRTFQLYLPNTPVTRIDGQSLGTEILEGSLTVDTTTGSVISASVFGDAGPLDFTNSSVSSQGYVYPTVPTGGGGGGNPIFLQPVPLNYSIHFMDSNSGTTFNLVLNTISLLDYNGGTICASGCALSGLVPIQFGGQMARASANGSTTPGTATLMSSTGDPETPSSPAIAATPEPSTLCLASSGLLGLAAQLRRRKQMSCAA